MIELHFENFHYILQVLSKEVQLDN